MTSPRRPEGAPVGGELVDEVYRFAVGPSEQRPRLDTYLHKVFKGRSRAYWQRMIDRGAVEVEGRPAKAASRIASGDRIAIRLDQLGRGGPRSEETSYRLLYEDDAILAVNKRAGAFCHPVGRLHNRSVVNDLRNARAEDGHELRPCHRLDRFVSGLLVFAKTREAAALLGQQFENRDLSKRYLALVHGRVARDHDRISLPLGKATNSVIRIKMGVDEDEGKPSVTDYRVIARYGEHTLVELAPRTGRRHQLRIHLAEIGHPIVNDPLYGPTEDVDYFERQTFDNHDDPADAARWIALHSRSLTFDHPLTNASMTLEAHLWGSFAEYLDEIAPASHAGGPAFR